MAQIKDQLKEYEKQRDKNNDITYKMARIEETLLTSKKSNAKVLNILEKAYKTTDIMSNDEMQDLINRAYNELITSNMEV